VDLCVPKELTLRYTEKTRRATEGEKTRMAICKSIIVWIIGVSFVLVTFPLTLITWVLSLPFDRDRVSIHWLLMYESFVLSFMMPIWKIHIEGREKAVNGTTYVIISNHQSMLDILLLNCLRYRYKWISKIENSKVPVIGWYIKMADYIIVDRGNEESKAEMLDKSFKCLKKGISVMIFPEADVPVLPVLIDGTGGILPKHGLVFGSGYQIRIRVLDPVYPSAYGTDNPDTLALKFSARMTSELIKLRSGKI
jgi:1-acyl-sn-glycerol-3-phosphate acyltransferase